MVDDVQPIIVWSGTFYVLGVDVKCHMLSNGWGVIEAESFAALDIAFELPMEQKLPMAMSDDFAAFDSWQKGLTLTYPPSRLIRKANHVS